ncbi:HAD family hydrolase [Streptomyces sp. 7-21]|jgi:phosphoglycolate phosphatase-like HAD superfamily hydrolase|uniref:HAD family hydrolase n=1 Tax=Streptomyces sp. 7-21 TaxID=2802283 RepID=UPI00191E1DA0|nr:HAD family hydrolase [Streptomyces sp. 7-21]MBL1066598.1 HAD family hydrolase [Streptomyces sp. 7-21]
MLILDFDGVVCDAFEECAVVTWYATEDPETTAAKPVAELVSDLPASFLTRFRTVRKYSRLLHHFMVAHDPRSEAVSGQREFDALFAAFPEYELATYVDNANRLRAALRENQRREWLALHTLYPGVRDLLERHEGRVSIVTAKDERSVWDILAFHRLDHTVVSVIGECGDKRSAVIDLVAEDGLEPRHATFIDDNLTNALQVRDTGARSLWAYWGYHTPEHVQKSLARRMRRAYLPDLAELHA